MFCEYRPRSIETEQVAGANVTPASCIIEEVCRINRQGLVFSNWYGSIYYMSYVYSSLCSLYIHMKSRILITAGA